MQAAGTGCRETRREATRPEHSSRRRRAAESGERLGKDKVAYTKCAVSVDCQTILPAWVKRATYGSLYAVSSRRAIWCGEHNRVATCRDPERGGSGQGSIVVLTVGDRAPAATASSSVDPLSASGGGSCPGAAAAITGDDGGSDEDRSAAPGPAPAPRGPPEPDEPAACPEPVPPPPAAPPRPEDTEDVLMASDARDRRASSRRMRSSYDAACRTDDDKCGSVICVSPALLLSCSITLSKSNWNQQAVRCRTSPVSRSLRWMSFMDDWISMTSTRRTAYEMVISKYPYLLARR